MKKLKIFLLLFIPLSAVAQNFEQFITSLNATPSANRQARVDSFINATADFPLVQNNTKAHFILTTSASSVHLAGDMNGWSNTRDAMTNVASTNMWYLTALYEANARLEYKFVVNTSNWILDPRNPNKSAGGFGENSELAMPGYIKPWEMEKRTNTAKGTTKNYTLPSTNTGGTYTVAVYLPANYSTTKTYATAYFQDGTEYLDYANAVNIFDNLIDSGLIEPMIAVFVKPNNRNEEYAFTLKDKYTDFFVKELVPWVDNKWSTKQDSLQRAIIGASYGGNISMYITLKHPNIFYKTGQQSGAWQPENYKVLEMFANSGKKDIVMASVWGSYEGLNSMWKDIEDSTAKAGYTQLFFKEHHQGHAWGFWKASLDEILIHLFPAKATSNIHRDFVPLQQFSVYPNPASEKLTINGAIENITTIELLDMQGKQQTVVLKPNGEISLDQLSNGIYLLKIHGNNRNETHRVIVGR